MRERGADRPSSLVLELERRLPTQIVLELELVAAMAHCELQWAVGREVEKVTVTVARVAKKKKNGYWELRKKKK